MWHCVKLQSDCRNGGRITATWLECPEFECCPTQLGQGKWSKRLGRCGELGRGRYLLFDPGHHCPIARLNGLLLRDKRLIQDNAIGLSNGLGKDGILFVLDAAEVHVKDNDLSPASNEISHQLGVNSAWPIAWKLGQTQGGSGGSIYRHQYRLRRRLDCATQVKEPPEGGALLELDARRHQDKGRAEYGGYHASNDALTPSAHPALIRANYVPLSRTDTRHLTASANAPANHYSMSAVVRGRLA